MLEQLEERAVLSHRQLQPLARAAVVLAQEAAEALDRRARVDDDDALAARPRAQGVRHGHVRRPRHLALGVVDAQLEADEQQLLELVEHGGELEVHAEQVDVVQDGERPHVGVLHGVLDAVVDGEREEHAGGGVALAHAL